MKKNGRSKKPRGSNLDLRAEYRIDYAKASPNRFAKRYKEGSRAVLLDPDIAEVFTTPNSVNSVLRALLKTMPRRSRSTTR